MTDEQIARIKFRFISHIAMSDYHLTQYEATNVPFQFNMQVSVPTSSFDWKHHRRTERNAGHQGDIACRGNTTAPRRNSTKHCTK